MSLQTLSQLITAAFIYVTDPILGLKKATAFIAQGDIALVAPIDLPHTLIVKCPESLCTSIFAFARFHSSTLKNDKGALDSLLQLVEKVTANTYTGEDHDDVAGFYLEGMRDYHEAKMTGGPAPSRIPQCGQLTNCTSGETPAPSSKLMEMINSIYSKDDLDAIEKATQSSSDSGDLAACMQSIIAGGHVTKVADNIRAIMERDPDSMKALLAESMQMIQSMGKGGEMDGILATAIPQLSATLQGTFGAL